MPQPAPINALEAAAAALVEGQPKPRVIEFADHAFPEQAAFIEDPSHLLVVLCTRRAGKSLAIGRKLYKTAYETPGVSCLYIALTRDSAKKIMWKDVLRPLNRQLGLEGTKFNQNALTVTLANGSVIYLLGVDSAEDEKEKLLGQKYAAVAIDEGASFTIDLNQLVYSVVDPATIDLDGWVSLTGTPGNLKRGLFFDLTCQQDPQTPGRWQQPHADKQSGGAGEWSGHRWNTTANPYMRKKWLAKIDTLRRLNPFVEETPLYQQEYLGRWVIDDSKHVYRYNTDRNSFTELPKYERGRWHYLFGCDLGFNDDTAFVVVTYHDYDPTLYVLETEKESKLDFTSTAIRIRAYMARFEFDRIIVDGANKQGVEEMKRRHQLPLHSAEKQGKVDFIELMNGDFLSGRIRLHEKDAAKLAQEYQNLIWNPRSEKREEHPSCPNHCADAALYAWRFNYSYLAEKAPEDYPRGSKEALEAQQEAYRQSLEDRIEEEREEQRKEFNEGYV